MAEVVQDRRREDALTELFELRVLDEQELTAELVQLDEPEPETPKRVLERETQRRLGGPALPGVSMVWHRLALFSRT